MKFIILTAHCEHDAHLVPEAAFLVVGLSLLSHLLHFSFCFCPFSLFLNVLRCISNLMSFAHYVEHIKVPLGMKCVAHLSFAADLNMLFVFHFP